MSVDLVEFKSHPRNMLAHINIDYKERLEMVVSD